MSESVLKVDMKQDSRVIFELDHGVIYFPTFDGIDPLDTNYFIKIKNPGGIDFDYQIGNGIVFSPTGIVWTLDTGTMQKKEYHGYLKSASNISGARLHIKLTLDIK